MVDVDTQDILDNVRQATQAGDQDRLFFLLVATPGGAPKRFHSDVIIPFLKCRGWKKVSYRNTGFRALYFLDDKSCQEESVLDHTVPSVYRCARCRFVDQNANADIPKKKRKARNSSFTDVMAEDEKQSCASCLTMTSTQRAGKDRSDLKAVVEEFKSSQGGAFQVHIVLSQPVDYEEDFYEFASQPGAIEA